jgi:hypothetical protein
MAAWLEPLKLQTFFMNIFAGNPDYFTAISIIVIAMAAGYFRMMNLTFFFMLGLFLLMFSKYILGSPIVSLFLIISGLVVGFVISRIWGQD